MCRAGDEQRSPGRTGIADVSVRKVAPLPVQSVTAARVLPPGPGSLWHWLGQLPDPRDPRGVRFSLPCVIAVALAARLAGCDSFTAAGEWSASRPQRVLKALGCPRHKRAGIYFAPSEKTIRRVCGLTGHDLADDLLCGWAGELAAISGVLSPARLQERRRDKARKAKARARKAARRERGARSLSGKQARKAAKRERKAAAAAIAASAAAIAGGRAKLQAGSAFGRVPVPATHPALPAAAYGDPRHVPALRGLGADGKASRGAKVNGQEAPQHLGFFWHGTRLNAAQRAVDRKTNETTVIGPVIDGMDLAGVCLTVDALHSLVDLNERVLARGGHVIFVIKGNRPRTYQALDAIAWDSPVAAATFEADRGRVETRSIQFAAAPPGLKYPGMEQAALIEHTPPSKTRKALTSPAANRPGPPHRQPRSGPATDLLALDRGRWAAAEATHYIRTSA